MTLNEIIMQLVLLEEHSAMPKGFQPTFQKVIEGISEMPEIIRCKDCEHWDTTWQNDFAPNYHYCPLIDGTRRDDFYCADAELRGDSDA